LDFTISSNARSSSGTRVATTGRTSSTSPASILERVTRTTRRRAIDLSSPTLPGHGYSARRTSARVATVDLGGVVLDPAFEQDREILDAIAQRRDLDAAWLEHVVELALDDRGVDGALEIEIRGGDDVDVEVIGLALGAIADRALERLLRRAGEVADVFDEEGATGGGPQGAAGALAGVFRRGDRLRRRILERRTDRDEATGATRALVVKDARDELATRAVLAGDQDRVGTVGVGLDRLDDDAHRRALGDQEVLRPEIRAQHYAASPAETDAGSALIASSSRPGAISGDRPRRRCRSINWEK
jgi:hypothetical protein